MLDGLEPWMVRAAIVVAALVVVNATLYLICAWRERSAAPLQHPTGASPHGHDRGRSVAA